MKKYILLLTIVLSIQLVHAQQPYFLPNVVGQTLIAKDTNGGPTTATDDFFGISAANIGDLNNDGVTDIVVGAERDDNGGASTLDYGAVYVCFMNANKTVNSSVKIGKGTTGLSTDLAIADRFGCSVAGIGDLNGDGNEDIVVGANSTDITSYSTSGGIYVIFLDSLANVLSYKRIVRGSNGGPTTIKTGSQFGISVAGIGDVDGDTIPDIAVGGHVHDSKGAAWVLLMNSNGTVKSSQIIEDGTAGIGTIDASDQFGIAMAPAGDRNDDGVPDLLVCANSDDDAFVNGGSFYLLYLNSSGALDTSKKYVPPFVRGMWDYATTLSFGGRSITSCDVNEDGEEDFVVGSFNESAFYILSTDSADEITSVKKYGAFQHWNFQTSGYAVGGSIAPLYDIDRDGKLEFVSGGYIYDSPGLTNNGAVLIIDMDSVVHDVNIGDPLSYDKYGEISDTIAGLDLSDLFGSGVCDLGDVNGDGFHDIAVGANGDDDGGTNRGAVRILFLDSLQQVIGEQKISASAGSFGTGLDDNDNFGASVCGPGDLDGDNVPDLVVGAYQDDDGGTDRGCVWVVYLNSNGTVKGKHKISDTRGGFNGTLVNGANFGISVAAIGDINNDGIDDLAVGAHRADDGGTDRGEMWILFMNAADSVNNYREISDTAGNFTATFSGNSVFFGRSVCAAGDLNDDGKEDLIVGSSAMDGTGAVYVLYLDTLGRVSSYKKINYAGNNFPVVIQSARSFGIAVSTLDDIDGNGYKEIVIGQQSYQSFGAEKGAVWVAFPDSTYQIMYTRLIGEEGPYFNTNLKSGENFGASVCNFLAADSIQRIFAGASSGLEVTQSKGVLYSWEPFAMNGYSLKKLAFGTTHPTDFPDRLPKAYKGFYDLNRTLDGGIYYPDGYYLPFKYYEEYRGGTMRYNVYRSNQTFYTSSTLVPTAISNEVTGTNQKAFGQNYFKLNFGGGGLALPIGNYILETINDKNEKMYLRFRVNKEPLVPSTPGPDGGGVLGP